MPGASGDRRLIGWANQIAGAASDEIERATTAAGNNQFLVNANRAYRQWADTFNSGPLGQLTSEDYQGVARVAPEQVLARFLGSTPTAQATVGKLYDAIATAQGAGAVHPAQALTQAFADATRQDFARVFHGAKDGGAAARAWLAQHARLFGPDAPPAFQQMRQEFEAAANDATALQDTSRWAEGEREDIAHRRLQAFLGDDSGRQIDIALKGDVQAGMRDLIERARVDPTGAALRQLSRETAERMLAEGAVPNVLGGEEGVFSGRAVAKWWQDKGQAAFGALDQAMPGTLARAQRIVNAMRAMDRVLAGPEALVRMGSAEKSLVFSGLGQVVGRLVGAGVGRRLYHAFGIGGPIQTPAIMSEFGATVWDRFASKLSQERAASVLVDALTDPDPTKLRALLRPLDSAEAAQGARAALAPYLRALPVAMAADIRQAQNPAPTSAPQPGTPFPREGDAGSARRTPQGPVPTLRGTIPLTGPGR